jgi:hypothetical protein
MIILEAESAINNPSFSFLLRPIPEIYLHMATNNA